MGAPPDGWNFGNICPYQAHPVHLYRRRRPTDPAREMVSMFSRVDQFDPLLCRNFRVRPDLSRRSKVKSHHRVAKGERKSEIWTWVKTLNVQVFKYVISHQAFRDRDIILFFNKNDILIEKINDGIKVTDFLPNMGFHGDPLNLHDVQVLFP